jgi:hypothetical protein
MDVFCYDLGLARSISFSNGRDGKDDSAEKCWSIGTKENHLLHDLVLMPNHLHLILSRDLPAVWRKPFN